MKLEYKPILACAGVLLGGSLAAMQDRQFEKPKIVKVAIETAYEKQQRDLQEVIRLQKIAEALSPDRKRRLLRTTIASRDQLTVEFVLYFMPDVQVDYNDLAYNREQNGCMQWDEKKRTFVWPNSDAEGINKLLTIHMIEQRFKKMHSLR